MREIVEYARGLLGEIPAEYADVRFVRLDRESVAIRNGKPELADSSTTMGFGVRVLKGGAWGFSASYLLAKSEIERIVGLALKVARSSRLVQRVRTMLAEQEALETKWVSEYERDPFSVPPSEKVDKLLSAELLLRGEPVRVTRAFYNAFKTESVFVNSEGSLIEQAKVECGGGRRQRRWRVRISRLTPIRILFVVRIGW